MIARHHQFLDIQNCVFDSDPVDPLGVNWIHGWSRDEGSGKQQDDQLNVRQGPAWPEAGTGLELGRKSAGMEIITIPVPAGGSPISPWARDSRALSRNVPRQGCIIPNPVYWVCIDLKHYSKIKRNWIILFHCSFQTCAFEYLENIETSANQHCIYCKLNETRSNIMHNAPTNKLLKNQD